MKCVQDKRTCLSLTCNLITLDVLQVFNCHLQNISFLQLGLLLKEENSVGCDEGGADIKYSQQV